MTLDLSGTWVPLGAVTGTPVRDTTGRRVGRVRDLVARLGARGTEVTGLVLGDLHGRWHVSVADVDLTRLDNLSLRREVTRSQRASDPLEPDELLLVRDVLGCRAYMVADRHTSRVGEVWLRATPGPAPSVAGVELGLGPALRRRAARRRPRPVPAGRLLRLEEVHLFSRRGHIVQLSTDTSPARRLAPDDLAHLLARLPAALAVDVLRPAPVQRPAAVEHLRPRTQDHLGRASRPGFPSSTGRRRDPTRG